MKKQNLIHTLRNEVAAATPDVYSKVMDAPIPIIPAPVATGKRVFGRQMLPVLAGACLAFAFIVGGVFAYRTPAAMITLDVNPSFEVSTNFADKVLELNPLNEDAQKVIENLEYKGREVDDVVEDLVDQLLDNGYLTDARTNSILISVAAKDQKADALKQQLSGKVHHALQSHQVSASILTQKMSKKAARKEDDSTSFGKKALVEKLAPYAKGLTTEQLMNMSVKELITLLHTGGANVGSLLEDLDDLDFYEDGSYSLSDKDIVYLDTFAKKDDLSDNDIKKLFSYAAQNKLDLEDVEDYLEFITGRDYRLEDIFEKQNGGKDWDDVYGEKDDDDKDDTDDDDDDDDKDDTDDVDDDDKDDIDDDDDDKDDVDDDDDDKDDIDDDDDYKDDIDDDDDGKDDTDDDDDKDNDDKDDIDD